ncbi:hypothetical protein MHPYR_320021 [uncultured Mycobacterium sp.]|uniref:Uncharacterized protein n=1 Tax=uncultured Mycobacterium sp. TaxID=171292 RepID=A0A1Y5PCT3_9MYCO|nr:hypothetical protein MHPYR_300057 [uncultured Mycobacterium sp.]SBS76443.1 hypothetical protein MHPYR_320021 [uncultured Mycobacterium sp.]
MVGAGGATTFGLNLLPSVGLSTFSVGVADGLLDGVVETVVVVVAGGGVLFSSLLHDATNEAMAMRAAPPTTAAIRALMEGVFMRFLFRSGELALAGGLR